MAVHAAREFKPDLILLDMNLQGLSGAEIAKEIKSEDSLKATPLIFLSGYMNAQDSSFNNNALPGYTFITKPVSTKELISCIKKELNK